MKKVLAPSPFIHRIDAEDRIIFVNEAWLAFAQQNDASHLTREAVLGQPLWCFIAGEETQHLYTLLLSQVRSTGQRRWIPFRCDSPDRRRFMEMEIALCAPGEVQFTSWLLREEVRPPLPLFEAKQERSPTLLTLCSWCKKVKISPTEWIEVEEAIRRLDLFADPHPPRITHGICPSCLAAFSTI
ncbi:MAG: hypothetical protein D6736_18575 [Nitrospinota bacterium]|nr:MAG: hypothetical protein D6736_18575 [Nitrospinota bacterium]